MPRVSKFLKTLGIPKGLLEVLSLVNAYAFEGICESTDYATVS